jgi:serine/threonine protein kinase
MNEEDSASVILKALSSYHPTIISAERRTVRSPRAKSIAKGGFGDIIEGLVKVGKDEPLIPVYVKRIRPPKNRSFGVDTLNEIVVMQASSQPMAPPRLMPAIACNIIPRSSEIHIAMPKGACDAARVVRKCGVLLSEKTLRRWSGNITEGLAYMHNSMNVIHGDVKPGNCIVFPTENSLSTSETMCGELLHLLNSNDKSLARDLLENTSLRISDFGLSVFCANEELGTIETENITAYTFLYRPPEIWEKRKKWSYSSDVWALGCSIFELWTGKLLFPQMRESKYNCKELQNQVIKTVQNRTLFPEGTPEWIILSMQACLKYEPTDRATSFEVLNIIFPESLYTIPSNNVMKPLLVQVQRLLNNPPFPLYYHSLTTPAWKEISKFANPSETVVAIANRMCSNDRLTAAIASWIALCYYKIQQKSKSIRLRRMGLETHIALCSCISAKVLKRKHTFSSADKYLSVGVVNPLRSPTAAPARDERIICEELKFKLYPFEESEAQIVSKLFTMIK